MSIFKFNTIQKDGGDKQGREERSKEKKKDK